jgi:acetyltransferase-like isoleucine patch superfamily enzyme
MGNPRDKFYRYKKLLYFLAQIIGYFPQSLNNKLLIFFRGTTGVFGVAIRYILIKNLAKTCGDNVAILEHVVFDGIHLMCFGDNVSINPYCYIAGEIHFGHDIAIANHTSFHSVNHSYADKDVPIKFQPIINIPIIVNNNVWIGSGCRILSGVVIEERVIIGAGAVVHKSIGPNTIVAGVPAKIIKKI